MRYLPNVVTLRLDEAACVGCGRCPEVCPHTVFVVEDRKAEIADRDACMECGACVRNCPVGAISVAAGAGCVAALLSGTLGLKSECCCSEERPCE